MEHLVSREVLNDAELLVTLVLETLSEERHICVEVKVGLHTAYNCGGLLQDQILNPYNHMISYFKSVLLSQISVQELFHSLKRHLYLLAALIVLEL